MDIWVKDLKTGDKWILDQDKNKIVYMDGTQTVFNLNDVGRVRFYPCDPDADHDISNRYAGGILPRMETGCTDS